jgi:MoaA/NifB/PqqE/SkfB family radical SAM enzyme
MEITTSGEVYTCCPSWTRISIGNVRRRTIAQVWNSARAQYIREKMYSGEWQRICNPVCPRISEFRKDGRLIPLDDIERYAPVPPNLSHEMKNGRVCLDSTPAVFNMSNSRICNLSCIMCDRLKQVDDRVMIEKVAHDIASYLPFAKKVILTGMGDPFARPDTRDLLAGYNDPKSGLRFEIVTNGLLMPEYWDRVKHQNFGDLLVSVDAADKEIYEAIRRGGSWEKLLDSLEFIRENRENFLSVTLNMTVMRLNYRQIPAFIDFAESYGFCASFQMIRGRCGDQNFLEDEDESAISELKAIIMSEKTKRRSINVFWSNLEEEISPNIYPKGWNGFYGKAKDRLLPSHTRRRALARLSLHIITLPVRTADIYITYARKYLRGMFSG